MHLTVGSGIAGNLGTCWYFQRVVVRRSLRDIYPLVLVKLYMYVAGTSTCPYFTLAFWEYSPFSGGTLLGSDRMGECLSQEVCAPILLCDGAVL